MDCKFNEEKLQLVQRFESKFCFKDVFFDIPKIGKTGGRKKKSKFELLIYTPLDPSGMIPHD